MFCFVFLPSAQEIVPLEKGMATHSSFLGWEIPRAEEPGGLLSLGSQRIRHDLATEHTHPLISRKLQVRLSPLPLQGLFPSPLISFCSKQPSSFPPEVPSLLLPPHLCLSLLPSLPPDMPAFIFLPCTNPPIPQCPPQSSHT